MENQFDLKKFLTENKLTAASRTLKENVEVVSDDGLYVEFNYKGELRKVDFVDFEQTEKHGNGFGTGYISGKDQFGNEWAMDAEFDMGSPIDWDVSTLEMI